MPFAGQADRTRDQALPSLPERDVHGEVLPPATTVLQVLGELPRPVQRVDDPDAVRVQPTPVIGGLLREDRVLRPSGSERSRQAGLGRGVSGVTQCSRITVEGVEVRGVAQPQQDRASLCGESRRKGRIVRAGRALGRGIGGGCAGRAVGHEVLAGAGDCIRGAAGRSRPFRQRATLSSLHVPYPTRAPRATAPPMTIDVPMAVGGLLVGTIVGLTGMGGGALMTPMLVFFFNVNPLTAISSDLVVSLLMKPVGAAVHLRRGTVNIALVAWLCVGSVPAAFSAHG